MSIKSVVLIGADGNLGPSIYAALIENNFDVTVLKRQSSKSKSTYPRQAAVSDAFEVAELAEVFKGHDAVVVTVRGAEIALQNRIADAAVRAGVKRIIPADFGSVDSSSALTQELVPLYVQKSKTRHYLIELAEKHPGFTWTSLVCGHFFDWSLEFLHLWFQERKADILDDGNIKWSASTLSQIALATVRVLQRPEVTSNRMIYIQSFCVTQNEVLKAFEKSTGEKWEVTRLDSKQYQDDRVAKRDEGDKQAIEDLVWLLGAIDANWEGRKDFAMKDLGLENEHLEDVVAKIVARLEKR